MPMDSIRKMNEALAYVEENLAENIDYREVARLALCSAHHFQRVFSFLAGVPLSEYIRRRRLSLAALELAEGGTKVIDVALKYGYSSPDSFARAFHVLHGIAPSEAKSGTPLKAYPRIAFRLSVIGGCEMKYRIVEKDAFRIVGVMKKVPIVFQGVNSEIASMAQSLSGEMITVLKTLSNTEPQGIIQASSNFSEGRMDEKGTLDHYIGVATTMDCPTGFAELEVPAETWAVFEAVGPFPETLQSVWGRIYSEWFPSSSYESTGGPEILWNEQPDTTAPDFKSEIWIPVRPAEM